MGLSLRNFTSAINFLSFDAMNNISAIDRVNYLMHFLSEIELFNRRNPFSANALQRGNLFRIRMGGGLAGGLLRAFAETVYPFEHSQSGRAGEWAVRG